ncbi:MAG: phospholipase D-like domain-containing protein [Candidatus Sumerlaeaceae bacterium]
MLIAFISIVVTLFVVLIIRNISAPERHLNHTVQPQFSVEDRQFEISMGNLLGPPILGENDVHALVNGCRYFPAMLEAVRSAEKTITFETFIFWSGNIGREFTEALVERANAGVRVHLLLDWFGCWKMEKPLLKWLCESSNSIQLEFYRPLGFHNLARFNNRTHRKTLVVDGKIGFTGGAGIADPWDGDAEDRHHWRDTQYVIRGPAVSQMQAAFLDNWMQSHFSILFGEDYFPVPEPCGSMKAQVFGSGPEGGAESVRIMYVMALSCARRSVRLAHSYFVPDKLSVRTIIAACKRGVDVELMIPGPSDAPITMAGMRSRLGPLLQAGVRVYQYQKSMFHCKALIVDELWTSVGSSNFDHRSFRLNDEVNLNVLDADFAREQIEIFEEDKKHCTPITWEQWKRRPKKDVLIDSIAGLFRAQM